MKIPKEIYVTWLQLDDPMLENSRAWTSTKERSDGIKYILAPEKKDGKKVLLDFFEISIGLADTCGDMSNAEFSEWILENVWADLDIDSPYSAVFGEVIDRLRGSHQEAE